MTIQAQITYAVPSKSKPGYIIKPHGKAAIRQGEYQHKTVNIQNARTLKTPATLDKNGFQYIQSITTLPPNIKETAVTKTGYPETQQIIQQATKAKEVHIFDHTIRSSNPDDNTRGTARHAHSDYTEKSIQQKLNELGLNPQNRRFVQLNAWRPLNEPVQVSPFTISDGATISKSDLIECDLTYENRLGEIYELAYNEKQQWYYYPKMHRNELILFKGYDSNLVNIVRYCPHSSFTHPDEQPDFPPRRSIEFRAIILY